MIPCIITTSNNWIVPCIITASDNRIIPCITTIDSTEEDDESITSMNKE